MNKELLLKLLRAALTALNEDVADITVEEERITVSQFAIYLRDEDDTQDIFRLTESRVTHNYPHSPDDIEEELLVQTKDPYVLVRKMILHNTECILDNVFGSISYEENGDDK